MGRRFLRAPVQGGDIKDFFAIEGGSAPLDEATAAALAQEINNEVIERQDTFWGNPERDSRRLAIHGRDVVLGEKALRLVGGEEVAIFPPLH